MSFTSKFPSNPDNCKYELNAINLMKGITMNPKNFLTFFLNIQSKNLTLDIPYYLYGGKSKMSCQFLRIVKILILFE